LATENVFTWTSAHIPNCLTDPAGVLASFLLARFAADQEKALRM